MQSKPWFRGSFEGVLDHFVKPKDAVLQSGSFSDHCLLLPLMGFPLGSEPLQALPG